MNESIKNIISIMAIVIGLLLLWKLKTIVGYILISLVLSLIGRPIMQLLNKPTINNKNLPDSIKSTITLICLSLFFLGFFSLFSPLIIEEARIISSIDINHITASLQGPINDIQNWLKNNHLMHHKNNLESELLNLFSFTQVGNLFNSIMGMLGNGVIALFSILFITFFLLKEHNLTNKVIYAFSSQEKTNKITAVLNNAKKLLTRYFIGIIIQILAITVIVSSGLSLLGINNAILIGFLAGVINVIPYIGPMIGALIGILIGISANIDLPFYTELVPLTIKIALVFIIMQIIDNLLFQPLIFSNSIKAHPLEIFLVVLAAGSLTGITGMIIAIPVYTLFRVVAKEFLSEFKVIEELTKNI